MGDRIVEKVLKQVVEGPKICTWWDPERSFDRSICAIGCEGDKKKCNNNHYSPQEVYQSKNEKGNMLQGDSFPDYLL